MFVNKSAIIKISSVTLFHFNVRRRKFLIFRTWKFNAIFAEFIIYFNTLRSIFHSILSSSYVQHLDLYDLSTVDGKTNAINVHINRRMCLRTNFCYLQTIFDFNRVYYCIRRFPLSRFLAKNSKSNMSIPVMKKFLKNLSFGVDVGLK